MRLRSSEGWKAKSEACQRLDRGQAGHLQRRLDATALADGELLGKQGLDRLEGAEPAALDLLDQVIERLQRPRHAQGNQVAADPLERGVGQGIGLHGCGPPAASR
jgi:hypothetical protein